MEFDNKTPLEQRRFVMLKITFSDGSVVEFCVSDILSSAWPQNQQLDDILKNKAHLDELKTGGFRVSLGVPVEGRSVH